MSGLLCVTQHTYIFCMTIKIANCTATFVNLPNFSGTDATSDYRNSATCSYRNHPTFAYRNGATYTYRKNATYTYRNGATYTYWKNATYTCRKLVTCTYRSCVTSSYLNRMTYRCRINATCNNQNQKTIQTFVRLETVRAFATAMRYVDVELNFLTFRRPPPWNYSNFDRSHCPFVFFFISLVSNAQIRKNRTFISLVRTDPNGIMSRRL